MLLGVSTIYTRHLLMMSWEPKVRERVRFPVWHRWAGGVLLIAGGAVLFIWGLLR